MTSGDTTSSASAINPRLINLVALLSDGLVHSGVELAAALGVSRTTVHKLVTSIGDLGLEAFSMRSKGYRLSKPVKLLIESEIRSAIDMPTQISVEKLHLVSWLDSTNDYLIESLDSHGPPDPGKFRVCVAEMQTRGRGRRGRSWLSPFGQNVYLSVLFEFPHEITRLSGFSLATSLAVTRACEKLGLQGVGVKWPNDLMLQDRKLGGVLTEIRGESTSISHVIVGIGVNLQMPQDVARLINQKVVALEELGLPIWRRNEFVGTLLGCLIMLIREFMAGSFANFRMEWQRRNALLNRQVEVKTLRGVTQGIVKGVNDDGSLVLQTNSGEVSVTQGEVHVLA